jgi:hypothetical protein
LLDWLTLGRDGLQHSFSSGDAKGDRQDQAGNKRETQNEQGK